MSNWMTPLRDEPVEGETVKVVDSDKWEPLNVEHEGVDVSVTDSPYDGEMDEKQEGTVIPPPWEEHQNYGRSELGKEAIAAATHANKMHSWSAVLTDLPDGIATDIKAIAEKLRQVVSKLV